MYVDKQQLIIMYRIKKWSLRAIEFDKRSSKELESDAQFIHGRTKTCFLETSGQFAGT